MIRERRSGEAETADGTLAPGMFAGFPAGGRATAVPNLFFAQLLPQMSSVEELIVTLYFFFAQGFKRRRPRFLTRRELEADRTLVLALARLCGGDGGEALVRGLDAAVGRGALLRARVPVGANREDLYLVNTAANRQALGRLTEGVTVVEEPLPPAPASAAPNIFALYEANVGSITPLIAEDLKEAEQRYPAEWILRAFREAVSLNKRSWRYIERILRRWEAEGPDHEEPERSTEAEWLARRYASGKRRGGRRAARA